MKKGINPTNTSRKADDKKSITLDLTAEQFERLTVISKMVSTKPEKLAVAMMFSEIDGWATWEEFFGDVDRTLTLYTEEPADASTEELGERIEDGAPDRLKKLAGYVSPEVAHAL